jgi:hypothetical protein
VARGHVRPERRGGLFGGHHRSAPARTGRRTGRRGRAPTTSRGLRAADGPVRGVRGPEREGGCVSRTRAEDPPAYAMARTGPDRGSGGRRRRHRTAGRAARGTPTETGRDVRPGAMSPAGPPGEPSRELRFLASTVRTPRNRLRHTWCPVPQARMTPGSPQQPRTSCDIGVARRQDARPEPVSIPAALAARTVRTPAFPRSTRRRAVLHGC